MAGTTIASLGLPSSLQPLYSGAYFVESSGFVNCVLREMKDQVTSRLFISSQYPASNLSTIRARLARPEEALADQAVIAWITSLIDSRVQLLSLSRPNTPLGEVNYNSMIFGFTACVFLEKPGQGYSCLIFRNGTSQAMSFAIRQKQIFWLMPADPATHLNLVISGAVSQILQPSSQRVAHCGHIKNPNARQCGQCHERYYDTETYSHQPQNHMPVHPPPSASYGGSPQPQFNSKSLDDAIKTEFKRCAKGHQRCQLSLSCKCLICAECNPHNLAQCPNGHQLELQEKIRLVFFRSGLRLAEPIYCSGCHSHKSDFTLKGIFGHPECKICEDCAFSAMSQRIVMPCCRRVASTDVL